MNVLSTFLGYPEHAVSCPVRHINLKIETIISMLQFMDTDSRPYNQGNGLNSRELMTRLTEANNKIQNQILKNYFIISVIPQYWGGGGGDPCRWFTH
jgi:hypothetical protein